MSGGDAVTEREASGHRKRTVRRRRGCWNNRVFLRDMEAERYLEIFFTAAVASILAIRTFLRLTGYFQLGGAHLHIAHVLWGGLLMCAAMVMLLSFTTKGSRTIAALCGGIGFGTFIDEVGKFVTRDVDYFYRPTFALIYLILVIVFLISREIRTRRYTHAEYLVNSLIALAPTATHDLDAEAKDQARHYLSQSDPVNPIVPMLREFVVHLPALPPARPDLISRVREFVASRYRAVASKERFADIVVIFFVVQQVVSILYVAGLIFFRRTRVIDILNSRFFESFARRVRTFSVIDYAEVASSVISTFLVVIGMIAIRRSRLAGLRFFKLSVLVSVFLTQVFTLYREGLWALAWLGFYLTALVMIDFMIDREVSVRRAKGIRDR
jgi:hypothetical protein